MPLAKQFIFTVSLMLSLGGAVSAESELLLEIWGPSNRLTPSFYKPMGTGFWITEDGHALTAMHVVAEDYDARKTVFARSEKMPAPDAFSVDRGDSAALSNLFSEGHLIELAVLECDASEDVCLLQAVDYRPNLAGLTVGGILSEDSQLEFRGIEADDSGQYRFESFLSPIRRLAPDEVISALAMAQGFSGGPVLSDELVVGIALSRNDPLASGRVLPIDRIGGLLARSDIRLRGERYWTYEARLNALENQVARLVEESENNRHAIMRLQAELLFDVYVEYASDPDAGAWRRDLVIEYNQRFKGQFAPSKISVNVTPVIVTISEDEPEARFVTMSDWHVHSQFEENELTSPLKIPDLMDNLSDRFGIWKDDIAEEMLIQIERDPTLASKWGLEAEELAMESIPLPEFSQARFLRIEIKAWFDELGEVSRLNYVREVHRLPI